MAKQGSETSQARRTMQRRGIRVCLLTLYIYQSLGTRQISSVLQARGHQCSLIFFKNFRLGKFSDVTPREEEILISLLRDLKPDLVGISLMTSFVADLAYGIASKIKERVGAPVIFGGSHASAVPEECIQHADFVCLGEGEEAITDLANAIAEGKPTDRIPNIWTKVDGQVQRNDVRPLVADLDMYPPLSFGEDESYFIEDDRVQKLDPATLAYTYQTTASRMCCPFNCTFCAGVWLRRGLYANKGRVSRYRGVSQVLSELKEVLKRNPGIELVRFWDEIFGVGAPRGWLDEFCERYPKEIGLPFEIWYHPSFVTEERTAKLKRAGLAAMWIGVESGSERVRREVLNRRETNEQILRSAEILHRHGIEVGYEFILDIPWLSVENCRGTFELVMRIPRPFGLHLHSLSLLPRAALTARALAEGLITREQVALAHRPLVDRFASHLWQYRLEMRNREAALWHTLIYLAGLPFIPRSALWKLYRLRKVLGLCPRLLLLMAEVARTKEMTGQARFLPALTNVYPGIARFLGRHPTVAGLVGRVVRPLAHSVWRMAKPAEDTT